MNCGRAARAVCWGGHFIADNLEGNHEFKFMLDMRDQTTLVSWNDSRNSWQVTTR